MIKIDQDFTVFLDRDGVINKRIIGNYVTKTDEFEFIENSDLAIAKLSKMVKYIFVITNQQGIGKKIMTERNLSEVHDYMSNKIMQIGGKITQIYHAPQLAAENSNFRKPRTGMAIQAMEDFQGIDLNKAIMVGDSDSDIQFGKNLGIITVRIKGYDEAKIEADYNFNSLFEFVQNISYEN